jgi:hypothetical protein
MTMGTKRSYPHNRAMRFVPCLVLVGTLGCAATAPEAKTADRSVVVGRYASTEDEHSLAQIGVATVGLGALTGLVAGHVACATGGCDDGVKVFLGVTDACLALGAVMAVAFVYAVVEGLRRGG